MKKKEFKNYLRSKLLFESNLKIFDAISSKVHTRFHAWRLLSDSVYDRLEESFWDRELDMTLAPFASSDRVSSFIKQACTE